MMEYFIKSALCMALLLVGYFFLLEKEKMYRFNRFYLLLGLLFSFLVPFIPITVYEKVQVMTEVPVFNTPHNVTPAPSSTAVIMQESPKATFITILLSIYGIVVGFFLFRFIKNICTIMIAVRRSPTVSYQGATLVLTRNTTVSHTFLHYIFINEEEYKAKVIEDELLSHELTHVRQRHSLDILFVELLYVFFWFNPILIFYKRAIQLNHEFLADEAVLKIYPNVKEYQALLLGKIVLTNNTPLSNSFNYLITKKRLTMMTKHLNRTRVVCKQVALLPLLAIAVFLFSTKVEAKIEVKPSIQIPRNNEKEVALSSGSKELVELEDADVSVKNIPQIAKRNAETELPSSVDDKEEAILNISDSYASVEVMPAFPGGINNFKEFISKNTAVEGTSGTIEIVFHVGKDGSVAAPLKLSDANSSESALLKAIGKSPKWLPGIQNGYPVGVKYVLTATFGLTNGSTTVIVDNISAISEEMFVSFEKKNKDGKEYIEGSVLNKDGQPLARASISTVGYKYTGISDKDGRFTIPLIDANPMIISHIGYKTKRIAL